MAARADPLVAVVGPARSGTSAVAGAIGAALGSEVVEGAAVLGLAAAVEAATRDYRAAVASFGPALRSGLDVSPPPSLAVVEALVRGRSGPIVVRVADVLPGAPCLGALPRLLGQRPGGRVVAVRRNAVEFVASRRRAFPTVDFLSHCLVWAEWEERWQAVVPALGDAVLSIDHDALMSEPAALARRVGTALGWAPEAEARFAAHATASRPGKMALSERPLDIASVAWSVAEKLAFAEICGPAIRASGRSLDIDAALRRRPLRLDEAIANGEAYFAEGEAGSVRPRGPRSGLDVVWTGGGARGIVVVPAVALNGRHRLKVSAAPLADAGGETSLRVDVVESLGRRPRAGAARVLTGRGEMLAVVEPTDELVDVFLTAETAAAAPSLGFRLFEATLAR